MEEIFSNKQILSITQEFERLTGQACYFMPQATIEHEQFAPEEGNCPAFCCHIAKSSVGHYLCHRKRQTMAMAALSRHEPTVSVCHVGLCELMVSAISSSKVVGIFNTCFAPTKLAANFIEQIDLYSQKYNCDPEVLMNTLQQISPANESLLHSATNLLEGLVLMHFQPVDTSDRSSDAKNGFLDKIIDETEELLSHPLLSMSLSRSIEQNKDEKDAYQASIDILERVYSRIFIDIRIGRLIKAKETFKALLNAAYLETDLDQAKYAVLFFVFQLNNSFLRKISKYKEVYDATIPIFKRISEANKLSDLRGNVNDYFDAIIQIYQNREKGQHAIINRIVTYVDENYANPFTVREMVKSLNVSVSYASRVFKEQMGVTIKWYINEIRMYHAQHFLRYTDWPVSMIAEKVGYTDVRSFYKMFEKHFDIPCGKLRTLYLTKYDNPEERKS